MTEIFFQSMLKVLGGTFIAIYITARLTLYFSFTRKIQKKWDAIRDSVIINWEKEYKTIGNLLNSKTSEDILVIAKENRGGTMAYFICLGLFILFSILSIVFGCVPSNYFPAWFYPSILVLN